MMVQLLRLEGKSSPRCRVQPYAQDSLQYHTARYHERCMVCVAAEVWYGVAANYTNDEHVAAAMLLEW